MGGFTCTAHENVDGVSGAFSASGPYTVTAGGAVTLTLPQGEFQGGVLAGGELAVLAGSTSDTEDPGLLLLIRATPIAESWDVQYGDHAAAGLERALIAGAYRSHVGTFTVVNSTDITVAWSRNQEGTVTTVPTWSSSWAIDPDAAFGFYDPTGSFFVGGSTRPAASPWPEAAGPPAGIRASASSFARSLPRVDGTDRSARAASVLAATVSHPRARPCHRGADQAG